MIVETILQFQNAIPDTKNYIKTYKLITTNKNKNVACYLIFSPLHGKTLSHILFWDQRMEANWASAEYGKSRNMLKGRKLLKIIFNQLQSRRTDII